MLAVAGVWVAINLLLVRLLVGVVLENASFGVGTVILFWCWDRYPTCASFVGLPRTSRGSAECPGRTRWMCDRAARPEPKHRCTSRVTGPNVNVDGLGM